MSAKLTRIEYDDLRNAFLDWAWAQGLKSGSDECGYHDDEPKAAEAWLQWVENKRRPYSVAAGLTGYGYGNYGEQHEN